MEPRASPTAPTWRRGLVRGPGGQQKLLETAMALSPSCVAWVPGLLSRWVWQGAKSSGEVLAGRVGARGTSARSLLGGHLEHLCEGADPHALVGPA